MAKYQIKHACGCTVEHNILGRNVDGEREQKAEWLASRLCYDCWVEDQNKGLTELEGSEKQINWAKTIRAKKRKELEKLQDHLDNKMEASKNKEADKPIYEDAKQIINDTLNNSSSKFWIENRETELNNMEWLRQQIQSKHTS